MTTDVKEEEVYAAEEEAVAGGGIVSSYANQNANNNSDNNNLHDNRSKTEQKLDELQECYQRIAVLNEKIVKLRNRNQTLLPEQNHKHGTHTLSKYQLQVRGEYEGHFGKIYSLDFGCDSQYICTASQDGLLIVWSALTGAKQIAIPLKSSWVMTCALSPTTDYSFIASGGLDNTVTIHKCNRFTEKTVYRELNDLSNTATKEESILATNSSQQSKRNSSKNALAIQKGYISGVKFLDNTHLLSSCGDANVVLWDLEQSAVTNTFEGHYGDVMSIDVNKDDPKLFVSGSIDRSAKVWDIRESDFVHNFSLVGNNQSDINSVKWFPDGKTFLCGLENGNVVMFDTRTTQQLCEYTYDAKADASTTGADAPANKASLLDPEIGSVSSVDVSQSGMFIFVSYDNGKINVFDTIHTKIISDLKHSKRISSCVVAPNGQALAAGCFDSKLRVYA